ncbi:MAG: aryl-sulfate sulfotransferase [Phycisphaerae bacterium]|nr:aryl-sulfate sulfotransferase [Phycisphaerae bacterium]
MCRKLFFTSFVLVLALVPANAARGADPDLVGWWRFEEGIGIIAHDSSSNGNDGFLIGGATWTAGRFGGGIELNGTTGYVSVPGFVLTTDTITFVAWLNGWKANDWAPLISSREVNPCEMNFGDNDTLHYTWNNDSSATWDWIDGPVIGQDTWTMLAVTIDPGSATAYVYTEAEGLTQATNAIAHIVQTVGFLKIGYSYGDRYIRGIIDEAAVYDRSLSEAEILKLAVRQEAYAPIPAHGTEDVPIDANLVWTRGVNTNSDEVWFGTDPCSLSHVADIMASPTSPPLYDPPVDLIANTTYYWQIVEVNGINIHPGPVWEFTTVSGAARADYPFDGAVISGDIAGANIWTKLIFIPGTTAVEHKGYFNEDYSKVEGRVQDANLGEPPYASVPGWEYTFFAGNPYVPPSDDTLVRGMRYYWTVDETDAWGNVFPGEIWKFIVQGYKAFEPSPPNEALFISPDVLLSWHEGTGIAEHDVYMGTNRQDVNDAVYDANTPAPEFLATRTEPNYQCSSLAYETKHYWRVDEVTGRLPPFDGTIYKGDVWEFTTKILTSGHREKGYLYLSPVPGAEYVSPQTRYFLVRFEAVSPNDITNLPTFIDVTGRISGTHAGQTKIASDNRTVIFEVSSGFSSDELVTVTLIPTVDPCAPGVVEPYQYQFMVTGPMPTPPESALLQAPSSVSAAHEQVVNRQATTDTECEALPTADMTMTDEGGISVTALDGPMIMPNGVSVPSDFPEVVITVNNNPSPGYIFISYPHYTSTNKYVMMLDNNGYPVWYLRGRDQSLWNEFKVQKNGMITMGIFTGYDKNFNWVKNYFTENGYNTNHHDLEVLEDGGYLMIGGRDNTVDMSRYIPGGNYNANVHETIIQEYTAGEELIFQFRSWDNFDISDVEALVEDPLSGSIRFPHINAIDVDDDGHLLISNRHISEITKINRDSGQMIWRLCGSDPGRSDFTFVNDSLNGFSHQHDISAFGNGRYMLFDNGNGHYPPVSRAVEYELDLNAMTATLVWEFRDTPDKYTYSMGNAQRLPTGNTLINFVLSEYPKAIEVDPNGVKQFEMNLLPASDLYQVHRFPWDGMVEVPYLVVESSPDYITLIFNKFGDPNVDYYRIYGGTTPQPTTVIATSTSTLKHISEGLENGLRYYFRVTAVDTNGMESDYSNEESSVVSFTGPGQNMVLNEDFCRGQDSWIWEVGGSANATWNIENGVSHFDITNGGIQISDVQLKQNGMKLVRGKEYVFEFDAWSDLPRIIEAKVGQDESPWTNYSKIGYSSVTPNPTHFRYPFTMQDASDYNARVVFNMGASSYDVYLDNVSLINVLPGDFYFDGCVWFDDLAVLTDEWLEEGSGLTADLQDNGRVDFNDFAIFAESFKYPCSTILVTEKNAKRVLVPTSNIGYDWIGSAEPYNDTGWDQIGASDCPLGVGYEDSPGDPVNYTDLIAHDVGDQMSGIMASCYIRIPFTLDTDPNELSSITLKIRYDDGFVAYINGRELARDNLNPDVEFPNWDDNADDSHGDNDARLLQPFQVNRVDNPDVFNALQLGDNILAIHGMNVSTGSNDFLISAELYAGN